MNDYPYNYINFPIILIITICYVSGHLAETPLVLHITDIKEDVKIHNR